MQQTNDLRLPSAGQLYLVDPATGFKANWNRRQRTLHAPAYRENTRLSLRATSLPLPRIETTVVVEDEYGARQDIDVGMVSPVEVSGRVLGADETV